METGEAFCEGPALPRPCHPGILGRRGRGETTGWLRASQYLAIEEFTVLTQIQNWTHPDRALSDLARRFLERKRFAMVEAPSWPIRSPGM